MTDTLALITGLAIMSIHKENDTESFEFDATRTTTVNLSL